MEKFKADCYYHVYNRGNNKENIFKDLENYNYFLTLMKKHLRGTAEVISYCLLPNHYHFLIKIKSFEELPKKYRDREEMLHIPFSNMLNAYAKAINKRYGRTGSLFQKNLRKKKIESMEQLKNVILYINSNSSHHGIENFKTYPFSSYQEIKEPASKKRIFTELLFDSISNFDFCLQLNKTWKV